LVLLEFLGWRFLSGGLGGLNQTYFAGSTKRCGVTNLADSGGVSHSLPANWRYSGCCAIQPIHRPTPSEKVST
jgi:hypothetical protein